MAYNPNIHHRQSIRLPGYDYTQPNTYFVTICAYQKECLFGDIRDGEIRLNGIGKDVQDRLQISIQMCEEIRLDEFIIMPNHIHFIVWIVGAHAMRPPTGITIGKRPSQHFTQSPLEQVRSEQVRPEGVWHTPLRRPRSLSSFVGLFKSATTSRFRKTANGDGQNLWQRNYFERVIRSEGELMRVREYILENPLQWELDTENPSYRP